MRGGVRGIGSRTLLASVLLLALVFPAFADEGEFRHWGVGWFEDPGVPDYGGYLQYLNGGEHDFWGGELEVRSQVSRRWRVNGSLSWMRDETGDGLMDYSLHHRLMVKAGVLYTGHAVSLGTWASHFARPGHVRDFDPGAKDWNNTRFGSSSVLGAVVVCGTHRVGVGKLTCPDLLLGVLGPKNREVAFPPLERP